MKADFIIHLQHNWPLAAAAAGLLLYIPVVLVTGTFFTNQGNITRKNDPTRYWRWVALFLGLLLASLVVLFGSYFLSSNPRAKLSVVLHQADLVSQYVFGTETATFHICTRCGTVPIVASEIDDHLYAVVNVNTFENFDPSRLRRATASFDAEDVDSRLARRRKNWIADVRVLNYIPS